MKRGFIVALLCAALAFAATASDKPSELKQVPKSEIAKLQETFKRFK